MEGKIFSSQRPRTAPPDPVTPFRRQTGACVAVVRMNHFRHWNSFRTLSPKGHAQKKAHTRPLMQNRRPEAHDWLAAENRGTKAGTRCTKDREWGVAEGDRVKGMFSSRAQGLSAHGEPHVSARE